ncbi:MAG: hypothetical protein IKX08_08580, partial [Lachnospiraceae bacterium]|nr:hypothetical protein [Lachnospiraceae bacterium]
CTIPDNKSKEPAKPTYKEGDVIKFGKYEQDGNTSNGKEDIEWIVVEVRDWTVLVVSKYALDYQPYNTSRTDTTWEKSSIRKWLNNDFCNAAFTKSELNSIPTVTHENKDNKKYGTKGGNSTEDKIFLLSLDDLTYAGMYNAYFSGLEQGLGEKMICEPTKYAISKGASVRTFTSSDYTDPYSKYYPNSAIGKKGTYWWLRDSGSTSKDALYCDDYGFFGGAISNYVDINYAVRPAMYLSYHDIPEPDEDAVPTIPKLNAGDTITFGRYEQDNNFYNGKEPIEWIVLEADDHTALLLSRYTLDYKDNYYENGDLWWLESPLHSWLNGDFMATAFTYNEMQFIKPVVLPNDDPMWAREYPGMSKEDYVFVLRCADFEKYFGKYQLYYNDINAGYNENLIVSPTPYAIAQGVTAYTITENDYYKADRYNPSTRTHDFSLSSVYSKDVIGRVSSGFWVRDMNVASNLSCSVNEFGYGGAGYLNPDFKGVGVRPAMYIQY